MPFRIRRMNLVAPGSLGGLLQSVANLASRLNGTSRQDRFGSGAASPVTGRRGSYTSNNRHEDEQYHRSAQIAQIEIKLCLGFRPKSVRH
jgi:hypothetical protein